MEPVNNQCPCRGQVVLLEWLFASRRLHFAAMPHYLHTPLPSFVYAQTDCVWEIFFAPPGMINFVCQLSVGFTEQQLAQNGGWDSLSYTKWLHAKGTLGPAALGPMRVWHLDHVFRVTNGNAQKFFFCRLFFLYFQGCTGWLNDRKLTSETQAIEEDQNAAR